MMTKTYARTFLSKLNEMLNTRCSWNLETLDGGIVMAVDDVATVAGPMEAGIFFDGEKVWSCIVLAEHVDLNSVPQNVFFDLMFKMNQINLLYGNVVVAFMMDAPDGDGMNFILRSINHVTFQNDPDFDRNKQWADDVTAEAAGLIADFINFLDNDLGTNVLEDFINMF